ncbi:MAG: GNAT family N-acetyltransferase [Gaiellales bacterium]
MRVVELSDASAFLELALPLLAEHEAVNCLPIGIATGIRDQPDLYSERQFWVVVDGDVPVGAALRTPPHFLVLARERHAGSVAALAAAIDGIPGVTGPQPEVGEFARAWEARTGGNARVLREEAVHTLGSLDPAPPVAGRMHDATVADLELLLEWVIAFAAEAAGERVPAVERHRASLQHRLESSSGGVVLWRLPDGRPVSLAGYGGRTPEGIRIGPVYTPPPERGHGYASALVSTLTTRLLTKHRFCFLFTDLANPTSNRIYARLGYERVGDIDEIELRPT